MRPAQTGSREYPKLELLEPLESSRASSPLAAARARRQLTLEEAARRSGLTPDQVTWLESGRVYAFRTPEDALAACVLLCAALEIDGHTAREVVGLPTLPRSIQRNPRGRLGVIVALLLVTAVAAAASGYFWRGGTAPTTSGSTALPPPGAIAVAVWNGGGDIYAARTVARRVQQLGYAVPRVKAADKFTYTDTAVYYGARAERIGRRLADQLCVPLKALPPGSSPERVVVITGPSRLSNC